MAFESRSVVTLKECLAMEAGKTGALLGCAAAIGAVLADAPQETVACLAQFGVEIGLSFQAVDDLLGIWGDPVATGKPAGSDLRSHKKSLPVVAALQEGGKAADELASLLAKNELLESEVVRAATLVEQGGGREAAQSEAHLHFESALGALERAELVESSRAELIDLANFIVDRKF
jgi:geranylgeranyl diphosphate synthase type I